ncbi:MAG: hypothetical protein NTY19_41305 [Planctomycetota bacterium]|nr:hypothetical protein [Planctomycetota bacterium]
MNGWHRFLAIAALLTSGTLAPAAAFGQGLWGGSYPGFWTYPYGGYSYQGNYQTPPYFAIHPPVYLGQRLAMPYGTSPLPRLPWQPSDGDETAIAPASFVAPSLPGVMIENPYVVAEQKQSQEIQPKRPAHRRRARS